MFSKGKKYIFLFLLVLLVNMLVFFPSFYHPARGGGQYHFLAEVSVLDNFWDLLMYSYSFVRVRFLGTGDMLAFRPLFYGFMCLQKHFFEYNFFYWQLTGFVLHLIVLSLLVRLLNIFNRNNISFLFVLNFSLLYISHEMVIWQHIHGYLLFLVFLLMAFHCFAKYVIGGQKNRQDFASMWLFLLISCFIFELGFLYSLIMLLALFMNNKALVSFRLVKRSALEKKNIRRMWWMLFIPFSYLLISLQDYFFRMGSARHSSLLTGSFNSEALGMKGMLYSFWQIIRLGLGGIIFPSFIEIFPEGRSRFIRFNWKNNFQDMNFLNLLNILFIFLMIILAIILLMQYFKKKSSTAKASDQECREQKIHRITLSGTFLSFFCTNVIMLFIGRMLNNAEYILSALYHFYMLLLFLFIGIYWLFSYMFRDIYKSRFFCKNLIIAILLISIFINGIRTYQLNRRVEKLGSPYARYVEAIVKFVSKHKQEALFSFHVIRSQQSDRHRLHIGAPEDQKFIDTPFIEFVYNKFIDRSSPKYFLIYTHKDQLKSFRSRMEAIKYYQEAVSTSMPLR